MSIWLQPCRPLLSRWKAEEVLREDELRVLQTGDMGQINGMADNLNQQLQALPQTKRPGAAMCHCLSFYCLSSASLYCLSSVSLYCLSIVSLYCLSFASLYCLSSASLSCPSIVSFYSLSIGLCFSYLSSVVSVLLPHARLGLIMLLLHAIVSFIRQICVVHLVMLYRYAEEEGAD